MLRLVLAAWLLWAGAAAASDDVIIHRPGDPQVDEPHATGGCRFARRTWPPDMAVYAAGGRSGRVQAFQIDESSHPASRFDVYVNSPGQPVALVLGGYEPTIWHVNWTPETKILGVIASGHYTQTIAGLPSAVPQIVSSEVAHGPCDYAVAYKPNISLLNRLAQGAFGRSIRGWIPGTDAGRIVIGQPLADDAELISSSSVSVKAFRLPGSWSAGRAGLEEALANGALRRVTADDLERWGEEWRRKTVSLDPSQSDEERGRFLRPGQDGYVVLKPFRFPTGLHGAHAVVFFVPRGVPRPMGDAGHSAVYDFNTMLCTGAMCRR